MKILRENESIFLYFIEKDTTVIDKTNTVADKNAERLKKEADRLQEHTKSSCRCWIWLLCVIVMVTFICEYFFFCFFSKTWFFFKKLLHKKLLTYFFLLQLWSGLWNFLGKEVIIEIWNTTAFWRTFMVF